MKLLLSVLIPLLVDPAGGSQLRGLSIGLGPTDSPTSAPDVFNCPVCGEDFVMTEPDGLIDGNITCLEAVDAANAGLISLDQCLELQPLAFDECGCEPGSNTTDAPTMPAPTDAPEPAPTDAPEPAPTDAPEPAPTDAPEPAPTDAPEPAPTDAPAGPTSPTETVLVLVNITFDGFAPEIGWDISLPDGTAVFDVPIGTYPPLTVGTVEEVELESKTDYVFTIRDLFGDGMSNPNTGTYYVTQDGTPLVSGGGNFGREQSTNFTTV